MRLEVLQRALASSLQELTRECPLSKGPQEICPFSCTGPRLGKTNLGIRAAA